MNPTLRNKLIAVVSGGVLAIAATLGAWYEGDGPTEKQANGTVLYVSYVDPVGIWTVCRGITGPEAGPGKKYTGAQCRAMEERRLAIAEAGVRRQIRDYEGFNVWRKAALVDWTFNLGEGALATSTMRAKFNAGDAEGGCRELSRWVKGRVQGVLQTLKGLVLRRADEQELCLGWQ